MQLTVLGGSPAGPNPGQGCSGYLLESRGTRIVLDLGPGTLPELRRHADFRELDAVILSHTHLDHMLDILALRYALAYNPVQPRHPLPLWLPPGGLAFLGRLATALESAPRICGFFEVFAVREYDPDGELIVGSLTVKFQPTVHYVPCWAMRVSDGVAGDLFYSADTGPDSELAHFARGSQVVIAEGAERDVPAERKGRRGHMTPREAGTLAREANAAMLILTHVWAENDPFAALDQAREAFGGPVELATPGLRVAWSDSGD
jgi:ribonuclease BN (tRNA processing enzyme)